MRLNGRLVFEQMIESAIEAIFVDLLITELQQIAEGRTPVPVLGKMQFACGFAQSRRHQQGGDRLPGGAFLAGRQHLIAQLYKARPAPQRQSQIHIAKLTRALDANAFQEHRHRHISTAIVEQLGLLGCADQMLRKRACLEPTMLIKLAEMCHRLLNDTPPDAHAAHQTPIAVDFTVLLANRMAQVHAPPESPSPQKEKTLGRHYTPNSLTQPVQPFDPTRPASREMAKTTLKLRKLG